DAEPPRRPSGPCLLATIPRLRREWWRRLARPWVAAPPTRDHAKELLADKGYDSDWFRRALTSRGITPCIPPTASRKVQLPYDKATLPPAPQDREPVHPPQGLAMHRNPL